MRPKSIDARSLTIEARAWAQILSHGVLPSTYKSSFTADLALLVWCVLTERPVNISFFVKQAISQVHARGNLPFSALVSDLVAAAAAKQRGKREGRAAARRRRDRWTAARKDPTPPSPVSPSLARAQPPPSRCTLSALLSLIGGREEQSAHREREAVHHCQTSVASDSPLLKLVTAAVPLPRRESQTPRGRSPQPALSPSVLCVAVAIHASCHRVTVTELQRRRYCTLLLPRLTKPSLEEEVALPPSELPVAVAYTAAVASSFCYYLLIVN
nr:uncharacterized protein LOC112734979 [Arachis hypogaea]